MTYDFAVALRLEAAFLMLLHDQSIVRWPWAHPYYRDVTARAIFLDTYWPADLWRCARGNYSRDAAYLDLALT